MTNILKLQRPPAYTTAEKLIEEVRQSIFGEHASYSDIAKRTGVSTSTIGNLANGKTMWPRPKTLFPLLETLNLEMRITKKEPRR